MSAAAFLWRGGVPAGVLPLRAGSSLTPSESKAARNLGAFELVISSKHQAAAALALLAEMDAQPAEFEPGWEAGAREPDLSALDSTIAPPCPACDAALPMDAQVRRCPACRATVDIVDLIIRQHGPDVLADAFDHAPPIPDDAMQAADVPCPKCAYSLNGLPVEGHCPECGQEYRKSADIRIWFG